MERDVYAVYNDGSILVKKYKGRSVYDILVNVKNDEDYIKQKANEMRQDQWKRACCNANIDRKPMPKKPSNKILEINFSGNQERVLFGKTERLK